MFLLLCIHVVVFIFVTIIILVVVFRLRFVGLIYRRRGGCEPFLLASFASSDRHILPEET